MVLGRAQLDPGLGGDGWDRGLGQHLAATRLPIHIRQSLAAPQDLPWQQAAQQFHLEVGRARHALVSARRAEFVLSTPQGAGSVSIERDVAEPLPHAGRRGVHLQVH